MTELVKILEKKIFSQHNSTKIKYTSPSFASCFYISTKPVVTNELSEKKKDYTTILEDSRVIIS
jgi:hypothetical protein